MKTFVTLSALVAATLAAPAADADAQLLGAGYAGLAGYTGLAGVGSSGLAGGYCGPSGCIGGFGYSGLAGGYSGLAGVGYSGVAGGYAGVAAAPYAAGVIAAPAATYAAAPAVSYAAAPVATVHHTVHQPIVPVHQVREHVTAPVVRQVGVNVHHQVQHIPQVHVDTKTSHAVSTHIINHAPQVGAFIAPGVAALPFAATPALVAAVPAVVAAAPAAVAEAAEALEAVEAVESA